MGGRDPQREGGGMRIGGLAGMLMGGGGRPGGILEMMGRDPNAQPRGPFSRPQVDVSSTPQTMRPMEGQAERPGWDRENLIRPIRQIQQRNELMRYLRGDGHGR
jgi:hypothetical protein